MKNLNKKLIIIILMISMVIADDLLNKNSENQLKENEIVKGNGFGKEMARKRIHRFHGHHLWIFGLHALAVLFAIKFKLFLIALAVGAAVIYGLKFVVGAKLLGGGCPEIGPPIYREAPPHIPIEPPYIPYDHHEHHYSDIGPYNSHASYGPSASSGYSETSPPFIGTGPGDITSPDPYHRRTTTNHKQKRDIQQDDGFKWSDIAFTFLGVNSQACRKRFTCEMEVKSKVNPFSKMTFKFLSDNFLMEYRNIDFKPKTIEECVKTFSECKFPDEISTLDDSTIPETQTNDIVTDINPPAEQIGRLILKRPKI